MTDHNATSEAQAKGHTFSGFLALIAIQIVERKRCEKSIKYFVTLCSCSRLCIFEWSVLLNNDLSNETITNIYRIVFGKVNPWVKSTVHNLVGPSFLSLFKIMKRNCRTGRVDHCSPVFCLNIVWRHHNQHCGGPIQRIDSDEGWLTLQPDLHHTGARFSGGNIRIHWSWVSRVKIKLITNTLLKWQ